MELRRKIICKQFFVAIQPKLFAHMQFQLSEEHLMIQKAARDFARNECLPGVIERDEHQKFPKEQILKLAELGFMGMMVDSAYGGSGMDTVRYVLAMGETHKIHA